MIDRRHLLRGAAVVAAISSAQSVAACSLVEFEKDEWGERLIAYLRTGETSTLDGLFQDHSTLVAFDSWLIKGSSNLSFSGASLVRRAFMNFRAQMTSDGFGGGQPSLQSANIVGNRQQGRMNKIELFFAAEDFVLTSCGPSRTEYAVDLFYEAGVHETHETSVDWSIKRMALMPKLQMERLNG